MKQVYNQVHKLPVHDEGHFQGVSKGRRNRQRDTLPGGLMGRNVGRK